MLAHNKSQTLYITTYMLTFSQQVLEWQLLIHCLTLDHIQRAADSGGRGAG